MYNSYKTSYKTIVNDLLKWLEGLLTLDSQLYLKFELWIKGYDYKWILDVSKLFKLVNQ